jgi:glycine/D-amino acid oxidase-like deaminating enzyme
LLARAGKAVAVIDDGNVGSGDTGRTTAHITHALDDRYYHIEKIHGSSGARAAAASHTAAIDLIELIVREEKIDCDFERLDGYLFLDPTDRIKSLKDELAATHRAGIGGTEIVDRAPIESFDTGPCLRFPDQGQFQPLKYLAGLARAIAQRGGQVYTGTHVQEVMSTGVKAADGHRVGAKKIVVATNAPIIDKISKMYDRQIAYRTYAIGARIRKGSVPKALYWDTGNHSSKNVVEPYHYVRVQELEGKDYDLLIVGGEDHETGNADDMDRRYGALESWAKRRFPVEGIEYRWSGQVFEPKDAVAFIGRNPRDKRKNVFIATGDSGNGMTHGTVAGIILTDLILGKKNEWARLYDPARKTRSGGKK